MKKTRNLMLSVLLALTMITGMMQPLVASAGELPATAATVTAAGGQESTETQTGDGTATQAQPGTEAQTGTQEQEGAGTANPPTSGENAGGTGSATENATEGAASGSPASTEGAGAGAATGDAVQAGETTGAVAPGTIALLGAPTGAQREPMELSDVVKSISFVNTGMAPITLIRVDEKGTGTAYLKMDLDFKNYDLVPGDYFVVEFPQQFKLKNESTEVKDGTDATITLGTLETVAKEAGGGTLKFTFAEDVKDRTKVFGQYLFSSMLTDTEGKHSYDLPVSGGKTIKAGEIELKITPATLSNITDEVLYKNGYSNPDLPVFEYHIRINREKRNLGNVTIEDSIKDHGRIVQFIKDSFVLQQVTYGDKVVGDGYGVARSNVTNIPLVEGQNIHFYNNDTKFVLNIPNVGTDSYYLAYRTNHYNDGSVVSNEAIIYDNGTRLRPYGAVVKVDRNGDPTGEVHPFNTRYLGHTRGIVASSVNYHALRSEVRGKLVIQKLDKDSYEFLKGAQFKVYTDPAATIEAAPGVVFTTDEKGTVVVSNLKLYTAAERNFYYVKEFKAPEGYKLSNEIKRVQIVPNGAYLTFYNEKDPAGTITLKASKTWITNEAKDSLTASFYVERKLATQGEDAWAVLDGTEKSLTGEGELTWSLPERNADGAEYQYRVKERSVVGYKSEVHEAADGLTFSFVNTQLPATTITLTAKKVWITNGDTTTPQVAKFRVLQELASGQTQVVAGTERSVNGNAEQSWTLPARDANGTAYQYRIEEFDIPSGYVGATSTEGTTVIFTNTRQAQPVQPPTTGGSGGGTTGGSGGGTTPTNSGSSSNTVQSEVIVDSTTPLQGLNSNVNANVNSASESASTNSMIAGAQTNGKVANIASAPKTGISGDALLMENFLLACLVLSTVTILLIEYTKKQRAK